MRQLLILFVGLLTFSGSTYAAAEDTSIRRGTVYDGSKYIFVENGIEFSVFPDGEFDFYIPDYVEGVSLSVNAGPVGISFNTGFDYDPYVQYDEFGAVIQIEDTPLYYDNYGRLAQAGDVNITYRNNRIRRVGGLQVFYNNYGNFSHYTGFINVYNRNYVFHPYHNYYYRPVFNRCLVWTSPYRLNFNPIRYGYAYHTNNYYRGYNNGYRNARRDFRRPDRGRVAHNNGRRDNVDRNNARFTRANTGRVASRSNNVARNGAARDRSRSARSNATTSRNGVQRGAPRTGTTSRGDRKVAARSGNTSRPAASRPVVRNGQSRPTTRGIASNKKARASNTTRPSQTRPATRPSTKRSSNKAVASNRGNRSQTRSTQRSTQNRATSSRGNSSRKATPQRSTTRKSSTPRSTNRSSNTSKSSSRSTKSRRG